MSNGLEVRPDSLLARYGLPPAEIERRSLAQIEAALGDRLPVDPVERRLVQRIIYAGGDLSLADLIRLAPGAASTAVAALRQGCPIITDVQMVATALNRRLISQLGCSAQTAIDEPAVRARSQVSGWPRAAEAMGWLAEQGRLNGAGVIVGNAPTALLCLLDLIEAQAACPAFIVGMPVGFVAARESKLELQRRSLAWLTIDGTRGGSPLAAAATNALLMVAADLNTTVAAALAGE